MTKPSNEQRLISDLLAAGDELQQATLQSGLAAMRRKRLRRHALRAGSIFTVMLLLLLFGFLHVRHNRDQSMTHLSRPGANIESSPRPAPPEVIPGTTIQVLNDQQLLDLFKGHPVALVGTPGKQKLIVFDVMDN